MANRSILNHGIRIASVLALLAGVMTSPLRPSRLVAGVPSPRFHSDNLALPRTVSSRISATWFGSQPLLVKALPAESEEELNRTTGPVWFGLDQPPAVAFKSEWILTASGFDLVFHPLRC